MSTHQQLLYHIVFSTKNRKRYLTDGIREDVFAYMAGTAKELEGFARELEVIMTMLIYCYASPPRPRSPHLLAN